MLPHDRDQRLHAMRAQRRERVRVCRHVRRHHPRLGRQRTPWVVRTRTLRPLILHRVEVPLDRFAEAPDGAQTGGQPLAAGRVGEQAGRAGGEEPVGDGLNGQLEGGAQI